MDTISLRVSSKIVGSHFDQELYEKKEVDLIQKKHLGRRAYI